MEVLFFFLAVGRKVKVSLRSASIALKHSANRREKDVPNSIMGTVTDMHRQREWAVWKLYPLLSHYRAECCAVVTLFRMLLPLLSSSCVPFSLNLCD